MHEQEETWIYMCIALLKKLLTREAIHFYPRYINVAFFYQSVFDGLFFIWWQRLLYIAHRNYESSAV